VAEAGARRPACSWVETKYVTATMNGDLAFRIELD
jgi:hypothetical protein